MIENIRFRAQDGLIILQVRALEDIVGSWNSIKDLKWRDARVEDLIEVSAHVRGDIANRLRGLQDDLDVLRSEHVQLNAEFHNVKYGSLPP